MNPQDKVQSTGQAPTNMPIINNPVTNNMPNGRSNSGIKALVSVIVVLLLIIAGYFAYQSMGGRAEEQVVSEPTEEVVEVTRADVNNTSGSKLPEGFPAGIPVEEATITESYRANYTQHGVTQYTVAFSSTRTKALIWAEYSAYVKTAGYILDTEVTNEAQGVMRATKGEDELNVVIYSVKTNQNYVTLNYLKR